MEKLNYVISSNIIRYRKELGLTQLELAEKLNYSDKAVSKWERGEGLPDIEILMKMCDIFGVTLNNLCYEEKKSKLKTTFSKHKHIYITALSSMLVWFIATIVFACLITFAPSLSSKWLCFIYAIPVTGIVLVVFNTMWGKSIYNIIFASLIVWGALLSICLTTIKFKTYWLLLIGIPAEALIIVWFIFRTMYLRKRKVDENINAKVELQQKG